VLQDYQALTQFSLPFMAAGIQGHECTVLQQ